MTDEIRSLDSESTFSVPSRPERGIWTPVRTFINPPQIMRIEASGKWFPLAGFRDCSADGFSHWVFARERLLTKKAPFGALIAKIGGSILAADGDIFVVGSLAVLAIEKESGPLYLTINDAPDGFDDNSGSLTVTIHG